MNEKLKKIRKEINRFVYFLFKPHSCICCKKECDLDNNYRLCSDCIKLIPFTKENYCLKCGEAISGKYDYCLRCKDTSYNFDYARSVFTYNTLTAPIITRFKYNGLKTHAKPLAHMLKDYYATSDIIIDCLTYVPMHKDRQKERGYNQAFELCKEFSLLTEIPMFDMLERKVNITKQSTLNAEERRNNIKGAFKIVNKHIVKGKDILIIDDVMTTGSTADECSRVLKTAGARSVCILTLAKTKLEKISEIL